MENSQEKLLLAAGIGVLIALCIGVCLYIKKRREHENFTRTPISACDNCQFVRSPVDYAMKPQRNPHHKANPEDFRQPLEENPIDMYAEERKLWDQDSLYQSMENDWIDGTKTPYIVNDNKTRTLLREVGDEGVRRILDNSPVVSITNAGLPPVQTEADLITGDRYPAHHPHYGGPSFFTQNMIGS